MRPIIKSSLSIPGLVLVATVAFDAALTAQGVRIVVAGEVVSAGGPGVPVAASPGTALGPGAVDEPPLAVAEVLAVQRALSRAGFDPGPHDGRLGPAVRRALRAFQDAMDLAVCGCVDEPTARALGLRPLVIQGRVSVADRGVEILTPPLPPAVAETALDPAPAPAPGAPTGPVAAPAPYGYAAPWIPVLPVGPVVVPRPGPAPVAGRPFGPRATRLQRGRPSVLPGR